MSTFGEILSQFLIFGSLLLPLIYLKGLRRYGKAYDIFTLYLFFIGIIQFVMSLYAYEKMNNIFLFHFYFIGQFIGMSLFYFQLLRLKFIYGILGVGLVILGIDYAFRPDIFFKYHTVGVSLTQSVIVFYALVYYYKSLTNEARYIYINTGIILYFTTSILFFASGNFFLEIDIPKEIKQNIGLINEILYLIFQIFIFIEWYKNYRRAPINT